MVENINIKAFNGLCSYFYSSGLFFWLFGADFRVGIFYRRFTQMGFEGLFWFLLLGADFRVGIFYRRFTQTGFGGLFWLLGLYFLLIIFYRRITQMFFERVF
jgi:hypothetical protein